MTRLFLLLLASSLAACGVEGPPEPVPPGLDPGASGIDVSIGGSASIGIAGGL